MGNSALNAWPNIIYGTAWKKDATSELTRQAINAGYRAIDTANQPLHYHEPGVGEGVAAARRELGLAREDLFLQTKFSPLDAQGQHVPYNTDASLEDQLEESLEGSLKHLDTTYLDSYLLHGPHHPRRMTGIDWAIWTKLEEFQRRGAVRHIGVSNVTAMHLQSLWEGAAIRPMAVQNRCFAQRGWDREAREFCTGRGIVYQGFSLLTANPFVLSDERVQALAGRYHATPAQIVFAFARGAGMIPLTGTTDERHMAQDLQALSIELAQDEVEELESLAG